MRFFLRCFFTLFFLFFFVFFTTFHLSAGEPSPDELHALSACLMDADSGRILYGKTCSEVRPNASTTKIMTCILALEYGNPDDLVCVSKYAASMPDVQLNMNTGEYYRLGDLLYSLMLESHNDTAVAIAEHISGDVSSFSVLMNEKAAQIGCTGTHFITPNGLDATETVDGTEYIHGTTAADLCLIMSYCIKNDTFLSITQTPSHTFTNYFIGDDGNAVPGNRSFTVNNKNAFLHMMDGVISGKTGFTGNAGYCYVTALRNGDRTFTVTLLGCGWPNNKTYKWQDASLLLNYGLENFSRKDLFDYEMQFPPVSVTDGITGSVPVEIHPAPLIYAVKFSDDLQIHYNYRKNITAPVEQGDVIGSVSYSLNDTVIRKYNLYAAGSVGRFDYSYCLGRVIQTFLLGK